MYWLLPFGILQNCNNLSILTTIIWDFTELQQTISVFGIPQNFLSLFMILQLQKTVVSIWDSAGASKYCQRLGYRPYVFKFFCSKFVLGFHSLYIEIFSLN